MKFKFREVAFENSKWCSIYLAVSIQSFARRLEGDKTCNMQTVTGSLFKAQNCVLSCAVVQIDFVQPNAACILQKKKNVPISIIFWYLIYIYFTFDASNNNNDTKCVYVVHCTALWYLYLLNAFAHADNHLLLLCRNSPRWVMASSV